MPWSHPSTFLARVGGFCPDTGATGPSGWLAGWFGGCFGGSVDIDIVRSIERSLLHSIGWLPLHQRRASPSNHPHVSKCPTAASHLHSVLHTHIHTWVGGFMDKNHTNRPPSPSPSRETTTTTTTTTTTMTTQRRTTNVVDFVRSQVGRTSTTATDCEAT